MNLRYLILLVISTALTALFNFLCQINIAKNSSPEVYGTYSTYLTFLLISIPLITIGISNYFIKYFSEAEKKIIIDINFIILILGASFFGLIIINLFFGFYFNDLEKIIIFLLSVGVLSFAYHEIYLAYLVGCESKKNIILWQPLLHLIRFLVLVLFILIYSKLNLNTLAWMSFIVSVIILTLLLYLTKSKIDFNINKVSFKKIKETAKESIWFGLIGFLYILYSQINIVYIDKFVGSIEAGYFNIGYTFLLMSLILPTTFYNKYLLPKLHRIYNLNKLQLKSIYVKGIFLSLFFGFMVCIFLNLLSSYIVLNFYGIEYKDSIPFFKYIILGIPFFYLSIHIGIFSYLGGFQKYKVYGLLFVTLFSLIINYFLVNRYGVIGGIMGLNFVIILLSIVYAILNKFFIFNSIEVVDNETN